MILREDGLNVLWESSVNWHTLDPNGAEDTDTELNTDEALNEVTIHDSNLFVPTTVDDLILQEDVRSYSHETQKFETLRNLLANHLSLMYRKGALRWPKTRIEILEPQHNVLPRNNFPNAGDIIL